MIRLLFIPFLAILLFSCESDSEKVDPLFYQISEADSTRCMNEILVSIVDEANQMFRFNRELLQSGVENIEQGISVIDADMRLVAWNQRYIQLLDYPDGFVSAGKSIEELLRYNIAKGVISSKNTGVNPKQGRFISLAVTTEDVGLVGFEEFLVAEFNASTFNLNIGRINGSTLAAIDYSRLYPDGFW